MPSCGRATSQAQCFVGVSGIKTKMKSSHGVFNSVLVIIRNHENRHAVLNTTTSDTNTYTKTDIEIDQTRALSNNHVSPRIGCINNRQISAFDYFSFDHWALLTQHENKAANHQTHKHTMHASCAQSTACNSHRKLHKVKHEVLQQTSFAGSCGLQIALRPAWK